MKLMIARDGGGVCGGMRKFTPGRHVVSIIIAKTSTGNDG
jgi:hypothetical protein